MYHYSQIFKQALKIAFRNPGLWFFGLFVSLLGSAGEAEVLLGSYSFSGRGLLFSFWRGLAEGGLFTLAGVKGIFQALFINPVYLFIILLIFLLVLGLSVLVVWLVMVSLSALISQTISVSRNQNLNWQEGWQAGLIKFWPVFGLNVLLRAIISALFLIIGLLAFFNFPGSVAVFIAAFDIFITLVLIVSFIGKYAICGVVLKDWPFIDAIKSAWELFKRNWLLSFELAIILLGVYLITNSILIFVLGLILLYSLKLFAGFTFGLVIIFLLIFAVIVFVQVILAIFHWASWAIVFELLTGKKSVLLSALKRGFDKVFG